MMTDIPHYIEQEDPGFQEYSEEDLILPEETEQQKKLKEEVIASIQSEFERLELTESEAEYLCHYQIGATSLENVSLFDLKLLYDWLRRLDWGVSSH
ncbi:MAG: hypothetical protein BRC47_01905 [Cyanobacteria bacterium QS_7_48_42]|jgi:hypothetical protein|nr:MAG: hypothetical protein BRC47_01905 [Cyanobacteria bacterium QS_7_48_42]PSP36509.1 MAG: hypothetical protein BRC57_01480 [Cyanobacteria bacterium QS_8_48_54]